MKFCLEFLWQPHFNSGHKQIYIPNVNSILKLENICVRNLPKILLKHLDFFQVDLGKDFFH